MKIPKRVIRDKDQKRDKPCANCKKKGRPDKPPIRSK